MFTPEQQGVWRRRLSRLLVLLAIVLVMVLLFHHLHNLVIMIFVGGGIAFILDPVVNRLSTRMPRAGAIALTYLGLIALLGLGIGYIVPRIVTQLQEFERDLPTYQSYVQDWSGKASDWYGGLPDSVKLQLENVSHSLEETGRRVLQSVVQSVLGVLGWLAKGVIILVLSIYLLLDKDLIRRTLLGIIPMEYREEATGLVGEILDVVRAYLRGQLVVIAFVAVVVTVGLFLFQVPYALTIGTMAGILEVIPYFGAAAGAIPAVLFTLVKYGAARMLMVVGFFVLVNQVEGHGVIPLVMGKTLEMRPLAVLLALLTGAEVAGVPGLIVAVPLARILQILGAYILKARRHPRDEGEASLGAFSEAGIDDVPPRPAPIEVAVVLPQTLPPAEPPQTPSSTSTLP